MQFIPAKVSLMAFVTLFKILSAHCVLQVSYQNLLERQKHHTYHDFPLRNPVLLKEERVIFFKTDIIRCNVSKNSRSYDKTLRDFSRQSVMIGVGKKY